MWCQRRFQISKEILCKSTKLVSSCILLSKMYDKATGLEPYSMGIKTHIQINGAEYRAHRSIHIYLINWSSTRMSTKDSGKRIITSTSCWQNCISTCKTTKLNPHLKPRMKVNLKIKHNTWHYKTLRRSIKEKPHDIRLVII